MRISPTLQVCSGLLSGLFIVLAGCGNPSSQTLASLTVTASPSSIPVGGAAVLKAVAHLSDGTTQDVTTGTQWSVSNGTLATIANGVLTAKAQGGLTVQAAYVEVAPAGSSPASATAAPQNLSASAQVTITAAGASGAINIPTITWNAAGRHRIRHSIEQYPIECDSECARNLRLHAGRRDHAQSGKANAICILHPDKHENLFCRDSFSPTYRESGSPDDYLGYAGPHFARNRPERYSVGCDRKCTWQLHIQPGRGRRSCCRYPTTDGSVFTDRHDRLFIGHRAHLPGGFFNHLRPDGQPGATPAHAAAPRRHRIQPVDAASLRAQAPRQSRLQSTRRRMAPAPHHRPAPCYLLLETTPSVLKYPFRARKPQWSSRARLPPVSEPPGLSRLLPFLPLLLGTTGRLEETLVV